ncbi:MAG: hypothetical protein ABUT20_59965, partial [Bacteroidota bacterium]
VKTNTEDIESPAFGHSVVTYNLTYDASNRVISLVSAANSGNKFVYNYDLPNTIAVDLYNDGVGGLPDVSYLVNDHIDSSFQYNDSGDSSTTKFIYDAFGNYIKLYEYDYSIVTGSQLTNITTYTYDANGNQFTAQGTNGEGEIYEYYTDLVYVHPLIGPPLIPAVKRNLIKTHSVTTNGVVEATATITYTFDSKDRMSTEKTVVDDGTVVIKTYTYF